jgi:hypothetical protein
MAVQLLLHCGVYGLAPIGLLTVVLCSIKVTVALPPIDLLAVVLYGITFTVAVWYVRLCYG